MTFHDLSNDVSKFSMTHVKQLFSEYCQNNLLFKVFSHIILHNMRAGVYFLTGINWFSDLSAVFSILDFFLPSHS